MSKQLTLSLPADKDYIKRAFRLAIDAHRTVLPLSYPPHAIAAACLYLTSFLTTEEDHSNLPSFEEGWASNVKCHQDDIEGGSLSTSEVMTPS